jgi:hypothetical protein
MNVRTSLREVTVAPGEYHVERDPEGPAFSIPAARRGERHVGKPVTAGPGEYEVPGETGCGAAWTFGSKPRPSLKVLSFDLYQFDPIERKGILACHSSTTACTYIESLVQWLLRLSHTRDSFDPANSRSRPTCRRESLAKDEPGSL